MACSDPTRSGHDYTTFIGRSDAPLRRLAEGVLSPAQPLRAAATALAAVGVATAVTLAAGQNGKPGNQVVFIVCAAAATALAGRGAGFLAAAFSTPVYIELFLNDPRRFAVPSSGIVPLVTLEVGFVLVSLIVWREQSARALSAGARELASVLDQARVFVWQFDVEADRLRWAGDAGSLTGRLKAPRQATLQDVLARVHNDDRADLEEAIRSALGSGGTFEAEVRVSFGPADWRWLQLQGTVARRAGRGRRASGLARDVTSRRRREERERFLAGLTQRMAALLDYDQMVEELARLIVPELCDWCAVDVLEAEGVGRNLVVLHVDPAKAELVRELFAEQQIDPNAPAEGTGEPRAVILDRERVARGLPEERRKLLARLGWRSAITVALNARGRTFGSLTLANTETPRDLDETDVQFLEEFGQLVALMLDNARLHHAERTSREQALATARQVERMQAFTARLSAATTPEEVARTLVEDAHEVLGACAGWVSVLSEDGAELRLIAESGYRPEFIQKYRRIPVSAELAVAEVVRRDEPLWLETARGADDKYAELAEAGDATGGDALVILPLAEAGRACGFVALRFEGPRVFTGGDRALISSFAWLCAQSLERSRLFERERAAWAEAELHRRELHFLGEMSRTLSATLELDEMLDELLRLTVPAVADAVSIFLLERGRYLRRAASVHVEPAKTQLMRDLRGRELDIETAASSPLSRAILERAPVGPFLLSKDSLDGLGFDERQVRVLDSLGMTDWYALPFVVRGRAIGVFTLATVGHRRFSERDIALAGEFASRAAVALANAVDFERERSGRTAAEQASERLAHLHQIAAALAEAVTPEEVAEAIVRYGGPALGADAAAVHLLSPDAAGLDPVSASGHMRELTDRYGRIAMVQELPAVQAVRDGELRWFESESALAERFPDHASVRAGLGAVGFIPLSGRDRPLGLFTVSFGSARPLADDDRALADVLMRQCGQALERARLFVREQEARRRAEDATKRLNQLQTIAEAGLAARSMEDLVRELLTRVSGLLNADRATVLLLDKEVDLLRVRAAIGLDEELAPDVTVPLGSGMDGRIAATGEPMIVPDLSKVEVVTPYLSKAGGSFIGVPLAIGRNVLGVLNVSSLRLNAFSDDDLELLELAAERAALALDQMMLYEREHQIAVTLQQSVLPGELPELTNLSLAVEYLPGRTELEVGGDWYDVIELDEKRVAVVIGDVVGKGVVAASAMAQLRNAVRVYALDGLKPGSLINRLGELARTIGMPFATVLYLVIDHETGLCRYASAGHPPPLHKRRDWPPVYLEGGRTTPIGIDLESRARHATVELEPGDLLLLYTDGLVESRSTTLSDGLERLSVAVESGPSQPVQLLDYIGRELGVETRQDDIAIVAIRWDPAPVLSLCLAAEPPSLAGLRRELQAWLTQVGIEASAAHDIVVACSEACANAILHAADPARPEFEVTGARRNGEIAIVVRDFGRWQEPVPGERDGGFGLKLMHALMDDVEVRREPEGTEVHLRRRLETGAPQPAA